MSKQITGLKLISDTTNSVIYTTSGMPELTIVKKGTYTVVNEESNTSTVHRKIIRLYYNNLTPGKKYKIKLWYGSNHSGTAQARYQHPYNTIKDALLAQDLISPDGKPKQQDISYDELQKRCYGLVMGRFNLYKNSNKIIVNGVPTIVHVWPAYEGKESTKEGEEPNLINASTSKLREYVLQTEWIVTANDQGAGQQQIDLVDWLLPLIRQYDDNNYCLLGATRPRVSKKTQKTYNGGSIKFIFSIEELDSPNTDVIFSNNTLILGGKVTPITIKDTITDKLAPVYVAVK